MNRRVFRGWCVSRAAGLSLLAALLVSCATISVPDSGTAPAAAGPAASAALDPRVGRMQEMLKTGLDRLDQGLVSDGIKQLVSVLAEKQQLASPSREADEAAAAADAELARLGSSLALEADTTWIDGAGNQKSGDTLDAKRLMPSVILTVKQAGGRSLVSNAPIQFAFVRGGGVLAGTVNTNDFGQANCAIARFDNATAEQVVRASLVYRAGGFAYAFKAVERDFVYAPPLHRAALLVLERSSLGVASDPFVVDPVFQELKAVKYDFSLFNGSLSPAAFARVYQGDPAAIAAMGLDKEVSYLMVVLNDCTSVRQLEVNGRKYNLFISDARATLRVVRKADGKVTYQTSVERAHARGTHGQGGTQEAAVRDVLRATAGDLAAAVKRDLAAVSVALKGE